jgi:predicted nucleic acid-binding Zn ribbon protein
MSEQVRREDGPAENSMGKWASSHCVVCGGEYQITHPSQKTCSQECQTQYAIGYYGRHCVVCGGHFIRHKKSKRLTCSEKCRRKLISTMRRGLAHIDEETKEYDL